MIVLTQRGPNTGRMRPADSFCAARKRFLCAVYYTQGRSQDFSKGGAEVMEAKAL